MQIAYQAKQSKSSQGTEQLKAPETSQTTLVHNFKVKAKGNRYQPVNTNRQMCNAQSSRHVSQATYKTKHVSHDKQTHTTNLYWSHWIIALIRQFIPNKSSFMYRLSVMFVAPLDWSSLYT